MAVLLVVILFVLACFAAQDWRASGKGRRMTNQELLAAGWSAEEADDKLLERQQALSEARCRAVEAETQSALAQFELAKAKYMEIRVYVAGGVVQGVTNIPAGVTVKVYDYDTDGADTGDVELDDDGAAFYPCIYPLDPLG